MKKNKYGGFNSSPRNGFKQFDNGKVLAVRSCWLSMQVRCYDTDHLSKHPTYKGCKVIAEWMDFQVFAKWYYDTYPRNGHKYQLDKDMSGLKLYSPSTCIWLPCEINTFLCDGGSSKTNTTGYIGVSMDKRDGSYRAQCRTNDNRKFVVKGGKCPKILSEWYIKTKRAYAKHLAEKWKGLVDSRVYDYLIKF